MLSYLEIIPICTKYLINGKETKQFPFPSELGKAKPVISYVKGWECDISKVRNWEDLPDEAKAYVLFLEREIGCPITYISVGPERDSIIYREKGDGNER